MAVVYALEPNLSAAEFVAVLRASGLAERRPVDKPEVVAGMLKHADIIVTARDASNAGQGRIIGVSRAIADFAYCCYLSDLAVDRAYQRRGIGKALIDKTWEAAGHGSTLILLSAPAALGYYPHIGMTKHEGCFILPRKT
jgi:ribosomal protein S18 acetylase RimI-like enzyme